MNLLETELVKLLGITNQTLKVELPKYYNEEEL